MTTALLECGAESSQRRFGKTQAFLIAVGTVATATLCIQMEFASPSAGILATMLSNNQERDVKRALQALENP